MSLFKARHSNVTRIHLLPPKSRQVLILSINLCEKKNGGKKASNEYTEQKNKGFDGKTSKILWYQKNILHLALG